MAMITPEILIHLKGLGISHSDYGVNMVVTVFSCVLMHF